LVEVDEAMVQGIEKQRKNIFCNSGTKKSDLDDVA
jgi:hypothetical protein